MSMNQHMLLPAVKLGCIPIRCPCRIFIVAFFVALYAHYWQVGVHSSVKNAPAEPIEN